MKLMPNRLTIAALALAAAPALAAAQRGITLEQAAGMRQVSNARISPNGAWVAYTVTTMDLKESSSNADIWIVPAQGGTPTRLTNHKAMDDQPRWAPDSRSIAFLSAREGAPQVYRLSLVGGEPEKVTESKTGVGSFEWSPDGSRIAYVAQRDLTADEEQKKKEKDDAIVIGRDWYPARLNVIDLATKKVTEVGRAEAIAGLDWSPNGKEIAYTVSPSPKPDDFRATDVMIADVAGGNARKLVENPGADADPSWSPDGQWIAFHTRPAGKAANVQFRLAVVAAGGGTPRMVAPDFLYAPGDAVWSNDGKSLYFWSSTRTKDELYRVGVEPGAKAEKISDVHGSTGLFGPGAPSLSSDQKSIAFIRTTIDAPPDIYVASLDGAWKQTSLTTINPELTSVAMGKSEVVRWKSKDGMEIEGIVVYPVGYQEGKRYPTVAIIHGGPSGVWNEAFPASWYNPAQIYASNGWISFLPNVRGSSAYGEKFLASNFRDWGGGDFQDIQTGLDYLIKRGIADSTKMAQSGWSYGGYMTAWTLTQTNRFKAVMVGAGLTDMYSMYSTNDLQMVIEDYFGAQPWDDEQAYRRASAMMFIKKAKTPTLILHGQADTRVPIGQAQELYMGLKKNNVPVELVFFPREPHGLQEPRHMMDKMKREYAFFSKYVLGVDVADKVLQ